MRLPVSHALVGTALLVGALALVATPAAAQYGGMGNGIGGGSASGMGRGTGAGMNRRRADPGQQRERAVAPAPPSLRADPWPRLDAGAVLCRTLEDLRRRVAFQTDPGSAYGPRPDCRAVPAMLPVTVVGRSGPGATQVQVSAPRPETGWTDAWLPDRGQAQAGAPGGRSPGGR